MEWPLVGRGKELERLRETVTGERPTGALLVGEAGVGKSRLLDEAAQLARDHGRAVERVYASVAAASIPFGAVAGLLPSAAADELALLRELHQGLERLSQDGEGHLLLAVDDVHLLDPGSLAFVHQAATSDSVVVVATLRSNQPIPASVTALWKDGHAERIDVGPLDDTDAGALVVKVLGGSVPAEVIGALLRASDGYPLYLRALVEAGLESGNLREEAGEWRLTGPLTGSSRLAELVASSAGRLTREERAALELVALAEPLPGTVVAAAAGSAVTGALVSRGGLRWEPGSDRRLVRTPHPLHAEVVVGGLDPSTRRARARLLATAWGATAEPQAALECARWSLEGGLDLDPEVAADTARVALGRLDHPLAARLAEVALHAIPDHADASLVLAEARRHAGDGDGAVEHLERAARHAKTDLARAQIAVVRAQTELLLRQDQSGALHVLDEAARTVTDDDAARIIAVEAAFLAAFAGRLADVVDVAATALSPGVNPETELEVATVIVFAQALSLRLDGVDERCARGLSLAAEHRDDRPLAEHQIGLSLSLARIGQGRPGEAFELAGDGARREQSGRIATGLWGTVQAFAGCFTGDLDAAADAGVEAVRSLEEADPLGSIGMAAMIGGVAALQAGRIADAEWLWARQGPPTWGADPRARAALEGRFEVWRAVATGDTNTGAEIAARVGRKSASDGQMLWAAATLHDAVRLDRADLVARDLQRLADDCDGALAPTLLAHADALDRGDVRALAAQSERLAEAGFGLFAVDAEAQAARLAARDGDPVAACRAATRARLRLRRCTGGPPPSLRAAPRGLSDRALEVVELAMAGATSKAIGEQLFVSTRTVDNHLRSAYRSLGVSRRDELSSVLGSALVETSARQVE